jgi:hypothetical protein
LQISKSFLHFNKYHLILAKYDKFLFYKTMKIKLGSFDPDPDLFLVNMGPGLTRLRNANFDETFSNLNSMEYYLVLGEDSFFPMWGNGHNVT